MIDPKMLDAFPELANALMFLFCLAEIWAAFSWPKKPVTARYPLKTRLLLAWPFGAEWISRISDDDVAAFDRYRARARIGFYFAAIALVLTVIRGSIS